MSIESNCTQALHNAVPFLLFKEDKRMLGSIVGAIATIISIAGIYGWFTEGTFKNS